MENENINQPPTNNPIQTPVQTQIQPVSNSLIGQKGFLPLFFGMLVLLIVVAGGAYYFGTQNTKFTLQTDTTLQPTSKPAIVSPAENPQVNETKGWITQNVAGLGLEFKLPDYFSQMDYPNGNETKGEKGKQFCIQYLKSDVVSFLIKRVLAGGGACSPTYFGLGTTSVDYEAGRMGGFGDLQGYTFENGKYYAKMVLGKRFEIPADLAKEITNPNGVKILRVIGRSEQPSEQNGMSSFPIAGTPGNGSIGALINFNDNTTYSGVAVEMKLEGKLNTELFDNILSTFKFTN